VSNSVTRTLLTAPKDTVPPTINLNSPDVGPQFNYAPLEAQHRPVNVAISNSFGFGGTNASLAFTKFR
jgi:3-oxoacyl-[acyl-carrier-protein] synthase II